MSKRIVSIGECMIEMSGGEDRSYRLGYAGDTLNTAWYLRALLGKEWSVDYVTALARTHTPEQFELEHIPGAINVQANTIKQNLNKIPKGKKIIAYCS